MPYYLAVDVGGTKTEYVLADETRELARVRGGVAPKLEDFGASLPTVWMVMICMTKHDPEQDPEVRFKIMMNVV